MVVALDARHLPKLERETVAELLHHPPGVRGFWTDDELLADAGLSSLPMLKKLQALDWVMPGHIPIEGGGRRRAWVFREVIRATLATELARAANLPILGVATLLRIIPNEWLEDAMEMEALIANAGGGPRLPPEARAATRICIVNMSEAWLERSPSEFHLLSQGLVISGAELRAPKYREPRPSVSSLSSLIKESAAVLMLNPARVSVAVVTSVARARGIPEGHGPPQ